MATTKGSGSRRGPQAFPKAPIAETPPRSSPYTVVLEHSTILNRAFDQVLHEVEWLRKTGFFWGEVSRRFMKTCRLTVEELRAWAMAKSRRIYSKTQKPTGAGTESSASGGSRSSGIRRMC